MHSRSDPMAEGRASKYLARLSQAVIFFICHVKSKVSKDSSQRLSHEHDVHSVIRAASADALGKDTYLVAEVILAE